MTDPNIDKPAWTCDRCGCITVDLRIYDCEIICSRCAKLASEESARHSESTRTDVEGPRGSHAIMDELLTRSKFRRRRRVL